MPLIPSYLSSLNRPGDGSTPARPNASGTIGWVSLGIGGATLLVAWIPYLGIIAVPVSLGGAAVGFVGIVIGRLAGQRRVMLPFWGMLLCGISIAVSYGSTVAWQNRVGAPGRSTMSSTPAPPAIDMRGHTGPFVPKPMATRPTFVMPRFDRPTTLPTATPNVER